MSADEETTTQQPLRKGDGEGIRLNLISLCLPGLGKNLTLTPDSFHLDICCQAASTQDLHLQSYNHQEVLIVQIQLKLFPP